MHWKEINRKHIYENAWIQVIESEVLDPRGREAKYARVHYKKRTVAILPISKEGKIVLVGQDRFPTQSYSWEIPMGGVEDGEKPLEAAKRELLEETGMSSDDWAQILVLETSNSVTDEEVVVFTCKVEQEELSHPDHSEVIRVQSVHLDKAMDKIQAGEIRDAVTVAAILHMKARQ